MNTVGLKYVLPASFLSGLAQTFNEDMAYLAKLGYQPPTSLLGRLVWNLPAGQLSDSRTRMPAVAQKSEDLSTYFGFDDRLLASLADTLRLVPGRYGITSAIKLEGAPTGLVVAQGFTNGEVLPTPWEPLGDGSRLTASVAQGVCDLRLTAGDTPEGLGYAHDLGNTYFGKTLSVTVSARVRGGDLDATRVRVTGYNVGAVAVYEAVWPLVKRNHRWVVTHVLPQVTDLGNLPGYETEALESLTVQVEFGGTEAAQADVYGLQLEQGFPSSLNLPTARGYDRLSYALPADAPETTTLTFWAVMPKQVGGQAVTLFGGTDSTLTVTRSAATPMDDPTLTLTVRFTDDSSQVLTLVPAASVLDELPHHWALGFGYDEAGAPTLYVALDGVDYGPDTLLDGRPCWNRGTAGQRWDLTGLLHFSTGATYAELENPAVFAGLLSPDDVQILYHTTVPLQTSSVPGALTSSGVGPWHVFNLTEGQTVITTGVLGQRLLDCLIDDAPNYEGVNFTYDPATGDVDFAGEGIVDPGPIDGLVARVRFASQAFTGGDADTIGGHRVVSADDPVVGNAAGAGCIPALNQFGQYPLILGLPANLFARVADLGQSIATLTGGVLTEAQRPVAGADMLGMVKVGTGLRMTAGRLGIDFTPVTVDQLNQVNGGIPTLENGKLNPAHLPVAKPGKLGAVQVAEENGLDVDDDGVLRLTVDPVGREQIGPQDGQDYGSQQLATLQKLNNRWVLHASQRPVALHTSASGAVVDKRGCVVPGATLSVQADGTIDIEASIFGTWNATLGKGLAKLGSDGKVHRDNRPIATSGELGTVIVGDGLEVNLAGLTQARLGKGLMLDAAKAIAVKLMPDAGLAFREADGALGWATPLIPTSALTGTLGADTRLAEVEPTAGGGYVVKAAHRPVAKRLATQAEVTTPATVAAALGMSCLPPTGWLQVESGKVIATAARDLLANGLAVDQVATVPTGGTGYGQPGVVFLGDPALTFLDVEWVTVPGSTDEVPVLTTRERPNNDFAEFNLRQERNMMAELVGKWVTYAPTLGAAEDSAAYVTGLEFITNTWKLRLSKTTTTEPEGVLIGYEQLTSTPAGLGRGYVAAGVANVPGQVVERITSLGTAVAVTASVPLFRSGACGAGTYDSNAYFFGGMESASEMTGKIVKVTAEEECKAVGAMLSGVGFTDAAAAPFGRDVLLAGGWTTLNAGVGTAPSDGILRFNGAAETVTAQTFKLQSTSTIAAAGAGLMALGFSHGVFFALGRSDTGAMRSGEAMTFVPATCAEAVAVTTVAYAGVTGRATGLRSRYRSAAVTFRDHGYVMGGRNIGTGFNVGVSGFDKFAPLSLAVIPTILTLADTDISNCAAVVAGDSVFITYSANTNPVVQCIDQMTAYEVVRRTALTLSAVKQSPTAASVPY